MRDRDTFLRPIAHRGLHDADSGVIENSVGAFAAAIAAGCGIECDVRPASDGTAMVFHDATLDRVTDASGPLDAHTPAALGRIAYRGSRTSDRVMTLRDLLDQVDGQVPLLVEIKNDFTPAEPRFIDSTLAAIGDYPGPIALMSFDPAVMALVRERAPQVPRGLVAGRYREEGWWSDRLTRARAADLSDLLESGAADPDFIAYHVRDLPTPVTRYIREVQGLPLFTWTVRTPDDRAVAARWADAAIFEGPIPTGAA